MKITITSKKATIKEPFRVKVEKKLSKLDKFFDSSAEALVKVSFERDRETVEITIRAEGLIFRAERTTSDKFDSLEAVVDVLTKQIVRNKDKLESKLRSSASFDVLDFADDYTSSQDIVKTKTFPVKPMDTEEAILQMDMLGHQFFMFRSVENGDINVVYRRNDGAYGLLIPSVE